MRRPSVLLAVCFALIASSTARALVFPQDSNNIGAIRGTAKDEAGAVIAGAEVQAVTAASAVVWVMTFGNCARCLRGRLIAKRAVGYTAEVQLSEKSPSG
jgi:hypothetical protein